MNHTHEGECIIIIYIDSYENSGFLKQFKKQEKTRNVWGILPVLQTTWVVVMALLGLGLRNLLQILDLAHLGPAGIFF